MSDELQIQIGDDTYTRVRVTAKVAIANEANTPSGVWQGVQAADEKLWWKDSRNPDLCHVRFVLDVEGSNKNWDYMPRPQLMSHHSTAVFKPFDMDHVIEEEGSMVYSAKDIPPVKNTIFGVMTHTALGKADGTILNNDEVKALAKTDDWTRDDNNRVAVIAWASLYSFLFPQTVANIVQEIDDGTMAVSMERWIKEYDFMAWDTASGNYQGVSREDAVATGLDVRWQMHQMVEGHAIYRRSLDYVYGGVAGTMNPAQPLSQFIAPSCLKAAASQNESQQEIFQLLLKRHSEVHQRFAIASSEEQPGLIEEHLRITQAIAALTGRAE